MSLFGDWEKEEIVEAIRAYATKNSDLGTADLIAEIMEAVSFGLWYATVLDRK